MKTWIATVRIWSIVGEEVREIEVVGRTQSAALKRVSEAMGNRDHNIESNRVKGGAQ